MGMPTKIVNKTTDAVTKEYLDSILFYDAADGVFYVARDGIRVHKGKAAGSIRSDGYLRIRITYNGALKSYAAHRLVWLHFHGYIPDCIIDHIDGNKLNNRIENLRLSDCSANAINTKRIKDDGVYVSGVGVSFHKARGLWRSTIRRHGKSYHIGHFSDPDDAQMAYMLAAETGCIVRNGKAISIM